MTPAERENLIAQNLIVVDCIVGKLLRDGGRRAIEKEDLRQMGYVEVVKAVDRYKTITKLPLDKVIARNVASVLYWHINRRRLQDSCRDHLAKIATNEQINGLAKSAYKRPRD